jgi:hypothetical protein
MINEDLARRSKENMSFSDYERGSATREYNAVVRDATEKIEKAKLRVSQEGKERLDRLLSSYCIKYANWVNRSNANGAGHVSALIAGPSNYNMKAHAKYMSREESLWKEYDALKNIDSKIYAIIRGDKIIKSNASDAVEQLQKKIEDLEKHQAQMKAANAYYRKNKTLVGYDNFTDEEARREDERIKNDYSWCMQPYPGFYLTNNNAKIRSAKERLAQISKLKERDTKESVVNGVRVVENTEAVRIQLFFDGKPELEMRNKLKSNGFHWSPKEGAWQRQLNNNGRYAARRVLEKGENK